MMGIFPGFSFRRICLRFDTDLILRYLLSVPSVRIAVLIVEMQDGRTKASFRSRGTIYVNKLAQKYGGGGHMNAAGCLFQFSSDKAQKVLLEDLRSFLREHKETNKELLNYGK